MKKTSKPARPSLQLSREAVRMLTAASAEKVVGGMMCSLGRTQCGSCCDMGTCQSGYV
jgi:hypothetical protein